MCVGNYLFTVLLSCFLELFEVAHTSNVRHKHTTELSKIYNMIYVCRFLSPMTTAFCFGVVTSKQRHVICSSEWQCTTVIKQRKASGLCWHERQCRAASSLAAVSTRISFTARFKSAMTTSTSRSSVPRPTLSRTAFAATSSATPLDSRIGDSLPDHSQ